jgi:hypothetical protein
MDPSTKACSLYNMLALGDCDLEEARLRASRVGCLLSMDDIRQAAEDLIKLGRVEKKGELYSVRGPAGLIVHKRDREDAWNRWELRAISPAERRAIVSPAPPLLLDDHISGVA